MTKQEAADVLGCSVRQLERYTSENRIGVRYEKGRTRPTPVYEESEVRAFKEALEKPVYRGVVTSEDAPESASRQLATQSDGHLSGLSQVAFLDALRVIAASQHGSQAPEKRAPVLQEIAVKPLLKLDEAAALTGLSRDTLRKAIDAGDLEARQIGRAFRIKRAALDAYIEKL